MTRLKFLAPLGLVVLSSALAAQERPLTAAMARQMLGISDQDAKAVSAKWNGQPTVFVEHVTDKDSAAIRDPVGWDEPPSGHVDMWTGERDKELRRLVAVQQMPTGELRSTIVTEVLSDAHFARVAGIGFANADRDRDRELIVIVQWEVSGGVGGGYVYQVRLFDQPDTSQPYLPALVELSNHFSTQFDGHTFDDRTRVHARFKTLKAVQGELKRLGY